MQQPFCWCCREFLFSRSILFNSTLHITDINCQTCSTRLCLRLVLCLSFMQTDVS